MTKKLSDEVMIDLCRLTSKRCFEAAMTVMQLTDDPAQKTTIAMTAAEIMLAATAKLASDATKTEYEKLVWAFSHQMAKNVIAEQPPIDWLKEQEK